MKKINKNGIRSLIIETLEEISLGESRKKEVEEADQPVPDDDEVAAAGRGARGEELNPEDFEIKPNLNPDSTKQLIDSYESTIPLFLDSLKKSPNSITATVVANNLKDYAKKFEELGKSGSPQQTVTPPISQPS